MLNTSSHDSHGIRDFSVTFYGNAVQPPRCKMHCPEPEIGRNEQCDRDPSSDAKSWGNVDRNVRWFMRHHICASECKGQQFNNQNWLFKSEQVNFRKSIIIRNVFFNFIKI